MNKKLTLIYEDGYFTVQEHEYIESGWFIESFGKEWKLFEIPEGGGKYQFIDVYQTLKSAYEAAINLT